MKEPQDTLSDELQRWTVTPPLDPEFRTAVWRRIEGRQADSWSRYLKAHALTLAAAAALAVAAAAYTGHAAARARVRADRDALAFNYLVDLDPWAQAVQRP